MNKKYGIIIDCDRCTGCYACFLACKDENCNEAHEGYTAAQPMTGQFWMNISQVERGTFPKIKQTHIPKTCGHCDNPTCMQQAEDGAVYKRDDGIVIIDPVKAVGQKQIVNTCPHRVIYWNEALQLPQKCDMCAHFLDQGYAEPRCVELCPTGALLFGDLNDPESEISKKMAETKPYSSHPEFELEENVLYLGIPKTFVTGTLVYKDTDQCAGGVTVTLKGEGVDRTDVSTPFGDFWFDGLDNKKDFSLEIKAEGYKTIKTSVRTLTDVDMDLIYLEK